MSYNYLKHLTDDQLKALKIKRVIAKDLGEPLQGIEISSTYIEEAQEISKEHYSKLLKMNLKGKTK